MRVSVAIASIVLSSCLIGCGGAGSSVSTTQAPEYEIYAQNADLSSGQKPTQLTYKETRNQSPVPPGPGTARWSIVSGNSIQLTPAGLATPVSTGATTVQVTAEGRTSTCSVYVGETSFAGSLSGTVMVAGVQNAVSMTVNVDGSVSVTLTPPSQPQGQTTTGTGSLSGFQPAQAEIMNLGVAGYTVDPPLAISLGNLSGTLAYSAGRLSFAGNLTFTNGNLIGQSVPCDLTQP